VYAVITDERPHVRLDRRLRSRFKAYAVIAGIPEPLLAGQIPLGRLHAGVPEQELNLFEFRSSVVTKARAHVPAMPNQCWILAWATRLRANMMRRFAIASEIVGPKVTPVRSMQKLV
jgi:hypothetical protein